MRDSGIVRRVDELGRIVLPIDIRRMFNIEEKDGVRIYIDEKNGEIILKKAEKMCIKCKSKENLHQLKDEIYLCQSCLDELR